MQNTKYRTITADHKPQTAGNAFSLIEVVTALMILVFVCTGVLTVYNRCMASAADLVLRMHAFEVARDNMEALLAKDATEEMVMYGQSDMYPQIQWQTTVETFYEPLTSRMWVQAVCSARYTDDTGQEQTIELTHWLTDLSTEDVTKILQQREKELTPDQIIATDEEAAAYAGVDVKTIEQWLTSGMRTTDDGYYIKTELDLYKQTGGKPLTEDKERQEEDNGKE